MSTEQNQISQFINTIQIVLYLLKFYPLPDKDTANTILSKELHLRNVITQNSKVIDHNNNWVHLQYF